MASLMAQWVKNAPAVQETQVPSLDQADSLEKEMATHTNILASVRAWQTTIHEVAKSQT